MKYLITIVVFLISMQIFSQIERFDLIDHENPHHEGIIQKADPIEQIVSPTIQNKEFQRSVKKTVLDNGYLLIEEIRKRFNGVELVNDAKYTITYDGNNNRQESYLEKWIDNKWDYDSRSFRTYDNNNNLLQATSWKYNSGPLVEYPWYYYLNDIYIYDQKNNVVKWYRQEWEANSWVNVFKIEYKYDGNNNVKLLLWYNWGESDWMKYQYQEYMYDENNNETIKVVRKGDGADWVNESFKESTYNENMIIECLYLKYDGWDWINNKKENYTYDENDEVIEFVRQKWQNSSWVNDLKREYTYNYYENYLSSSNMYLLFHADSGWVYNQRISYAYHSNGDLWEIISYYPEWYLGYINWGWTERHLYRYTYGHNLIEDKFDRYDNDNHVWETHYLKSCKYTPMTGIELDIDQISTFELSNNYPNPFNPSTKIRYSIPNQSHVSLKVFDVLGREVNSLINEAQPQGNYEVEFDASNLSNGIYFYRIQADQFVMTKKMILLK